MTSKTIAAACAGLLISGCAHSYPDLATFRTTGTATELGAILNEAELLQAKYSVGYKETAKWQDLGQLPIVGAAAVAGLVLVNDHANAAKTVSKIGIGTLAYSSARGQLTAVGLPEAYIAGHGALTCILAEGSYFHGPAADLRRQGLLSQLVTVAQGIERSNFERYREPTKIGTHAEALKAARTVADQAIATARTAQAAALIQYSHYLGAAPSFRNAVSNVSVRVASKGRIRPSVDYATLRDAIAPPAPPAAGEGMPTFAGVQRGGNDAITIIQDMMQATQALSSATATLTGSTPRYSESLKRVDECPAKVG